MNNSQIFNKLQGISHNIANFGIKNEPMDFKADIDEYEELSLAAKKSNPKVGHALKNEPSSPSTTKQGLYLTKHRQQLSHME